MCTTLGGVSRPEYGAWSGRLPAPALLAVVRSAWFNAGRRRVGRAGVERDAERMWRGVAAVLGGDLGDFDASGTMRPASKVLVVVQQLPMLVTVTSHKVARLWNQWSITETRAWD